MAKVNSNYQTDLFMPILKAVESHTKTNTLTSSCNRIIADHLRSAIFLIADGVFPDKTGPSYVLRRILRRAISYAFKAEITEPFLAELVPEVIATLDGFYPEISSKKNIFKK